MANTPDLIQQVESIQREYRRKLPPVQQWNPPLSGTMDMRIAEDGRWFHDGVEIKRQSLADLFSTILKRENGQYYLVTPVEKWRIQVDDAPFLVIGAEHHKSKGEVLAHYVFSTKNGDEVVADKQHPLWIEYKGNEQQPRPYLMIRDGMPGLLNRNVYYQLVEDALRNGKDTAVGIHSCGEFFALS